MFFDAWELRKLSQVAEFNPKSILPAEFEYVDLESVVGTTMISHRTEKKANAPSRAQRLAKKGDVFYQTVRPYQKNNYLFDLTHDNYVFSTGYAQIRPNIYSYFLLNCMQEDNFVKKVLDRSTGTSYPSINSNDLADIEIKVPKKSEEQQKIGQFFKQLDNTIALHQRKLDTLKQMKKGFLQQMFPENEEKVPKVRFADFEEEWAMCKLGASVESIGTGSSSFSSGVLKSGTTPYEVLGSTSVISYDNDFDYSGDFVLTARVGANAGKLYKHSGDVKISDNTVYIQSSELDFIFSLLDRSDLKRLSFGTGQPLIKASELKNLILAFPTNRKEKAKIGKLFSKFDDTIALHQQRLEQLKTLKKGYLQNMFI
ncbi:restriction endonuclease subunit S [Listeria rocourtiae]|uniref:restriction endonuclease subunit S n=1 Tax=Listeria rocourtiae TaxID=647910 RepID=UPI0003E84B3B|nr:restriction endonuclease subunit S [Listeria rocourtiae]EUJ42793.1 restriction modification system DNA specificity domain-containing protein [Listeria rocourtiae FSL F6-920]